MKNNNNLFYTCSLIELIGRITKNTRKVFSSWIAERILNFNADLFYQAREYIAECYRAGVIIPA